MVYNMQPAAVIERQCAYSSICTSSTSASTSTSTSITSTSTSTSTTTTTTTTTTAPIKKIPRPPNSFILYRKEKSQEYRNCTAAKLSRILGARWKKEKPEIKAHFAQRAKDEEEKHAIEHPDYKFQPAKRGTGKLAKARQNAALEAKKASTTSQWDRNSNRHNTSPYQKYPFIASKSSDGRSNANPPRMIPAHRSQEPNKVNVKHEETPNSLKASPSLYFLGPYGPHQAASIASENNASYSSSHSHYHTMNHSYQWQKPNTFTSPMPRNDAISQLPRQSSLAPAIGAGEELFSLTQLLNNVNITTAVNMHLPSEMRQSSNGLGTLMPLSMAGFQPSTAAPGPYPISTPLESITADITHLQHLLDMAVSVPCPDIIPSQSPVPSAGHQPPMLQSLPSPSPLSSPFSPSLAARAKFRSQGPLSSPGPFTPLGTTMQSFSNPAAISFGLDSPHKIAGPDSVTKQEPAVMKIESFFTPASAAEMRQEYPFPHTPTPTSLLASMEQDMLPMLSTCSSFAPTISPMYLLSQAFY